jgi:hypothetical protein
MFASMPEHSISKWCHKKHQIELFIPRPKTIAWLLFHQLSVILTHISSSNSQTKVLVYDGKRAFHTLFESQTYRFFEETSVAMLSRVRFGVECECGAWDNDF